MLETLHPSIRGAISAGWEGMTFAEDEHDGALCLVCSTAAASRIAQGGPCLSVRLARGRRSAPGTIVLSVRGRHGEAIPLGVDLAYEGGRALALRLATTHGLRLWLVSGGREPRAIRAEVMLRDEARCLLARAAAHAGEWSVADPLPQIEPVDDGVRLPRLARAQGEPDVALQVPLERLPSLSQGGSVLRLEMRRSDGGAPGLVLSGPGAQEGDPLTLEIRDADQRVLAARAADNGQIVVVGVIPGDASFISWAEADLSPEARRALRHLALIDPAGGRGGPTTAHGDQLPE